MTKKELMAQLKTINKKNIVLGLSLCTIAGLGISLAYISGKANTLEENFLTLRDKFKKLENSHSEIKEKLDDLNHKATRNVANSNTWLQGQVDKLQKETNKLVDEKTSSLQNSVSSLNTSVEALQKQATKIKDIDTVANNLKTTERILKEEIQKVTAQIKTPPKVDTSSLTALLVKAKADIEGKITQLEKKLELKVDKTAEQIKTEKKEVETKKITTEIKQCPLQDKVSGWTGWWTRKVYTFDELENQKWQAGHKEKVMQECKDWKEGKIKYIIPLQSTAMGWIRMDEDVNRTRQAQPQKYN